MCISTGSHKTWSRCWTNYHLVGRVTRSSRYIGLYICASINNLHSAVKKQAQRNLYCSFFSSFFWLYGFSSNMSIINVLLIVTEPKKDTHQPGNCQFNCTQGPRSYYVLWELFYHKCMGWENFSIVSKESLQQGPGPKPGRTWGPIRHFKCLGSRNELTKTPRINSDLQNSVGFDKKTAVNLFVNFGKCYNRDILCHLCWPIYPIFDLH